jgi:ribosome biogenesis GTPase
MNLTDYGWDGHFKQEYDKLGDEMLIPARITADYGRAVRAVTDEEELLVERHINDHESYCVGDFICLAYDKVNDRYSINTMLARKTKFSRAAAGPVLEEQIVASNVDTVFIMQSLNNDFNMRRLERYLISVWESGAVPVVVLTKSDLCEDVDIKMSEVFAVAAGADIYAISSITGDGLDALKPYLKKGKTIALLGSSGVGKSTLVNTLSGNEILKVQEVLRDDDRGRHTTTHRQLVLLPGGGVLMDTPGMRTLGLWQAESGMDSIFGDIEELAQYCKFNDCSHESEPGCAVKEALDSGNLAQDRWESYKKLKKELAHIERKKQQKQRIHEKQFAKMVKSHSKEIW